MGGKSPKNEELKKIKNIPISNAEMPYDTHQVLLGKQNLIQKEGETKYITKKP